MKLAMLTSIAFLMGEAPTSQAASPLTIDCQVNERSSASSVTLTWEATGSMVLTTFTRNTFRYEHINGRVAIRLSESQFPIAIREVKRNILWHVTSNCLIEFVETSSK